MKKSILFCLLIASALFIACTSGCRKDEPYQTKQFTIASLKLILHFNEGVTDLYYVKYDHSDHWNALPYSIQGFHKKTRTFQEKCSSIMSLPSS
ncbi:hypothetical protein [Porphyromonas pogonae]|uniref:hypothetical protein n=1 Tax=Porphyromonas pogonae TaxID=867595 RepID=UPI002E7805E4|nr:hypothetical protein [Porphyromonas pogonae]